MIKEQLKEAVGELNLVDTVFEADGVSYIDTAVSVMQVYDLIDLLEEPEKVVIPSFVAEAFEKARGDNAYAEQLISATYESSDEVGYWLEVPSNEKLLLRAWLDGYEVEEEQKCYILDSEDIPLLERWGNKIQRTTTQLSIYEKGRDSSRFELTEQEIKDYDKRFWPFAVEVAE